MFPSIMIYHWHFSELYGLIYDFPKFNLISAFCFSGNYLLGWLVRSKTNRARAHTLYAVCRSTPACPGRRRGLASKGETTWCWTRWTTEKLERWSNDLGNRRRRRWPSTTATMATRRQRNWTSTVSSIQRETERGERTKKKLQLTTKRLGCSVRSGKARRRRNRWRRPRGVEEGNDEFLAIRCTPGSTARRGCRWGLGTTCGGSDLLGAAYTDGKRRRSHG